MRVGAATASLAVVAVVSGAWAEDASRFTPMEQFDVKPDILMLLRASPRQVSRTQRTPLRSHALSGAREAASAVQYDAI